MPSASALKSKQAYNDKLCTLLDNHTRAFVVGADNVGSRQFMDIRAALRPQSTVLMGKNTMIRKCIKDYCERKGDNTWMSLYEKMVGNVGVIFTSGELDAVKEKIKEFVVPAPAKAGAIAQVDVTVEAGPTGMEPSQTNFFQTLNIATKINKGAIEILSDVKVLSKGDKVTTSAAALLGKLGVTPFFYGLEAMFVYDAGNVFDVAVLDISDEDITAMFGAGLKNIAALSLQANYPTIAAVPHAIINGYKNVLAIAVGTDYTFPLADKVKEYLANPGAAAAKAPEPEEEEEEAMDFDLFD